MGEVPIMIECRQSFPKATTCDWNVIIPFVRSSLKWQKNRPEKWLVKYAGGYKIDMPTHQELSYERLVNFGDTEQQGTHLQREVYSWIVTSCGSLSTLFQQKDLEFRVHRQWAKEWVTGQRQGLSRYVKLEHTEQVNL